MYINNLYIKSAKSQKKSVNKGNLAIRLKCFKTMQLENTPGLEDPRVKRPQGVLDPRERQKQLKLPVLPHGIGKFISGLSLEGEK
jgi:hypothetical protein